MAASTSQHSGGSPERNSARGGWPDEPSSAAPRVVQTRHGPCNVVDEGPHGAPLDGAPLDGAPLDDAPVLLLIHGVPGTVRDFRWLAPCTRDALRTIRFDMPGFGATPLSSGLGFDIVDRANFVVALLDALELQKVAAVGHSMGAAVAAALAIHHPERVSHVGLWASPGLVPHRKFRKTRAKWVARAMKWPVIGPPLRTFVTRAFSREGFPAAMGGADVQTVMDYAAGLDFVAHRRRVEALELPTMVAYCDDDNLIETEICRDLATACPDGPRAAFVTGSHNLQKTHALELGAVLVEWLLVEWLAASH